MTSPGLVSVKSTSASRFPLILPVGRQKVKGIGPDPLEIAVGSEEQEPAGSTDRSTIAPGFRHDFNTYAVIAVAQRGS